MPQSLSCHFPGCNFVLNQHPAATEKQAAQSGKGFNEFCDTWLCRTHRPKKEHHFSKSARMARGEVSKTKVDNPVVQNGQPKHRGRTADPKWAGMTSELHCCVKDCVKIQKQHPSLTLKAAQLHGQTFDQFVNHWRCKLHRKM